MTPEGIPMSDGVIRNMPTNSGLLTQEEFTAWIASRKEAGAKIDIGSAELKGWWAPEGDPYAFGCWKPPGAQRHYNDLIERSPHFFVRDPKSRGWVWQGDLPDDKRAITQARIDEHQRKVEEYYAARRAAGLLIDTETCEEVYAPVDECDPYGIELAPYNSTAGNVLFVRNKNSDEDWILVSDLPSDKKEALRERGRREWLVRKHIVGDLLDAMRQGRVGLAGAKSAVAKAENTYGEQIVKMRLAILAFSGARSGGS